MNELNFRRFKEIAQPKKILTRVGQEKWYGLWIRKISVILSFLIYKIPRSTPNMITITMALWGPVASAAILLPGLWGVLVFFLGFQFWTTLDSMDGELARAKKVPLGAGGFLDGIAHIFAHASVFIAVGLKFYLFDNNVLYL